MEEKTLLINNLKINYKIAGSGPAILILHGWGGSSSSWVGVQKNIAARGFKVLCPDFPGFGKSDSPKDVWDVTDYMNWTVDFVKSQNLEKFFILAHSFGGRVAIKFALNFPDKIEGLIFCNSAGIKHEPDFKAKIILQLSKLGNLIFTPKFLARFKDRIRNLFYFFLRRKDYIKANGIMREIIKRVLDEDLLPCLSQIKERTLIVWGKRDKLVPIEDANLFKEKIKNSKLKILPNIGHSPHLEAPEELTKIILDFIISEKT
jgi:pimeloyl-ACP methyl ester carboxylesterase